MASVFTPFLRRFTDERARDIEETRVLYERVRLLIEDADELHTVGQEVYGALDFPEELRNPIAYALYDFLTLEDTITTFPDWPEPLTLQGQVDLNRFLRAKEHYLLNRSRVRPILIEGLRLILSTAMSNVPETESPSPFTIPLLNTLSKDFIGQLCGELGKAEYVDNGLFVKLSNKLYYNLCEVSGISNPLEPKRPFKHARDMQIPMAEAAKLYLKGTPIYDFLQSPIPLHLTHEDRFSHMHIVGGSGAGKTTLLQNLILHDLHADDPPALVIIDSQGDLVQKVSHLQVFEQRNLILITPKDLDHPPALNIFDVTKRLGKYDAVTREQVTAGAIQTFDYLFTGLLGADLTAKQGVFFRYVARLMLALPETMGRNATILDMIDLMEDATPYQKAIASLPDIQKRFFQRDFPSKTFQQTKEQIRYRLQAILENPTLARLFTSTETKIDLFQELNNGSVIIVDTAKDFLKSASANFGKVFISLILQAILERAAIPEHKRKPAFLIVDEAASYFDSNIDDLLTEARKYKLGCIFAHQFLDQCSQGLKASFAANTAIKMVGGVSTADARAFAPEMRTTQDFILSQPRLHFACFIRNVTPQAVSVPVEVGKLEAEPQLDPEDYEAMMAENRLRVSVPSLPHHAEPAQPPQPDEAIYAPAPEKPKAKPPPPNSEADEEW